jgi:hypothetical protein
MNTENPHFTHNNYFNDYGIHNQKSPPQFKPIAEEQAHQTMFTTPRKETYGCSSEFYNSDKKSSPESLFTPLRIPGTTKFDSFKTSIFLTVKFE